MPSTNKKRLIQNLLLFTIIFGLVFFLWAKQQSENNDISKFSKTLYDKSIGDEVAEIMIHVEGREDILLKNIEDNWSVVKPLEFVADKEQVQHLFTLLSENADTSYDLEGKDLTQYGLDKDRLSISFDKVKFIFGEFNPVSQKRFILKGDKIYLVSETVTGLLQAGVDVFKIKETNLNTNTNSKPVTENIE